MDSDRQSPSSEPAEQTSFSPGAVAHCCAWAREVTMDYYAHKGRKKIPEYPGMLDKDLALIAQKMYEVSQLEEPAQTEQANKFFRLNQKMVTHVFASVYYFAKAVPKYDEPFFTPHTQVPDADVKAGAFTAGDYDGLAAGMKGCLGRAGAAFAGKALVPMNLSALTGSPLQKLFGHYSTWLAHLQGRVNEDIECENFRSECRSTTMSAYVAGFLSTRPQSDRINTAGQGEEISR